MGWPLMRRLFERGASLKPLLDSSAEGMSRSSLAIQGLPPCTSPQCRKNHAFPRGTETTP
jgi:hypothetical protein